MPIGPRISATALGLAAAAALGLSQPPAALAATQSAASTKPALTTVEVCGQGADLTRPGSMILTCADGGEVAQHLTWTSWTSAAATATGQVTWRSCSADCAHSTTWQSAAAEFSLSRPEQVQGHGNVFTRLTLHTTGPTPTGFMRDLTFEETPAPVVQAPAGTSSAPVSHIGTTRTALVPAAASGTLGYAQIEGYWIAAGGSAATAETAAAITGAEASFEPGIIQQGVDYCGSGGDRAGWGLWQITCGNAEPSFGTNFQLLDPWNNAEAAVAKYDGDVAAGVNGFDPWSTYTSGAYQSYLGSATPATNLTDPGEYGQNGGTPSGTPSSPAAAPGSTYGPAMNGGSSSAAQLTATAPVGTGGGFDAFFVTGGRVEYRTGSPSGTFMDVADVPGAPSGVSAIAAVPLGTTGNFDLFYLVNGTVYYQTGAANGGFMNTVVLAGSPSGVSAIAANQLGTPTATSQFDVVYDLNGTVKYQTGSASGTWMGVANVPHAPSGVSTLASASVGTTGNFDLFYGVGGAVDYQTGTSTGGWLGSIALPGAPSGVTAMTSAPIGTGGNFDVFYNVGGTMDYQTGSSTGGWLGTARVPNAPSGVRSISAAALGSTGNADVFYDVNGQIVYQTATSNGGWLGIADLGY